MHREKKTGNEGSKGKTKERRVVCLRRWLCPAQWWHCRGFESVNNLLSHLKEHTHTHTQPQAGPELLIKAHSQSHSASLHTHAQTKATLVLSLAGLPTPLLFHFNAFVHFSLLSSRER